MDENETEDEQLYRLVKKQRDLENLLQTSDPYRIFAPDDPLWQEYKKHQAQITKTKFLPQVTRIVPLPTKWKIFQTPS